MPEELCSASLLSGSHTAPRGTGSIRHKFPATAGTPETMGMNGFLRVSTPVSDSTSINWRLTKVILTFWSVPQTIDYSHVYYAS